jgi:hypothetical protein
MSCAPYASYSVSSNPSRRLYLPLNAARHSLRQALPSRSIGQGQKLSLASKPIRICCDMLVVMPWRTRATIHDHCKLTWAIRTSSTQSVTLNSARHGLRIFGARPLCRLCRRPAQKLAHGPRSVALPRFLRAVLGAILPAQQFRQLGDVGRDAPRLVIRGQLGRRSVGPAHPRNRHRPASVQHCGIIASGVLSAK